MSLSTKDWSVILFLLFGLSVILHFKSFVIKHREGDELVYMGLAHDMNYNLTHYTTMDHPQVKKFPSPIYREPLFIHPPFYPLILKVGWSMKNPVLIGLIWQNLSMGFILIFAFWAGRSFGLGAPALGALLTTVLLCPILLFSTTKIHLDGLFAIYSFMALVSLVIALQRQSVPLSFLTGILFVLALNIKYTSLILLPPLLMGQGFFLYQKWEEFKADQNIPEKDRWSHLMLWENWKCFYIIFAFVMVIGIHHHIRFFITYKTLLPWHLIGGQKEAYSWNAFTRSIYNRTRGQMLYYIIAIFPCILVMLTPQFWKTLVADWKKRSPEFLIGVFFIYFLVVAFAIQYKQMRYFSHVLPFFYLFYAFLLNKSKGTIKTALWVIWGISLLFMITTGFNNSVKHPGHAKIIPSLIYYIPGLPYQ